MARAKSVFPGDPTLLAAALEGLELQKARIEEQIRSVHSLMGGAAPRKAAAKAAKAAAPRKKRQLSAAARKRIAVAQKKRWAAFRKKQKEQAKAE
jgi:hypothetical protein